jgi:hypothetical protein
MLLVLKYCQQLIESIVSNGKNKSSFSGIKADGRSPSMKTSQASLLYTVSGLVNTFGAQVSGMLSSINIGPCVYTRVNHHARYPSPLGQRPEVSCTAVTALCHSCKQPYIDHLVVLFLALCLTT